MCFMFVGAFVKLPTIWYNYSKNPALQHNERQNDSPTQIFQDVATLTEGFFGIGRYEKISEERIDWLDETLQGEKWF